MCVDTLAKEADVVSKDARLFGSVLNGDKIAPGLLTLIVFVLHLEDVLLGVVGDIG